MSQGCCCLAENPPKTGSTAVPWVHLVVSVWFCLSATASRVSPTALPKLRSPSSLGTLARSPQHRGLPQNPVLILSAFLSTHRLFAHFTLSCARPRTFLSRGSWLVARTSDLVAPSNCPSPVAVSFDLQPEPQLAVTPKLVAAKLISFILSHSAYL